MKSSEADILVVSGLEGTGPQHWQRRMVAKLSTTRFIDLTDWQYSSLDEIISQYARAFILAHRPVVIVAHSAGAILAAHAIPRLREMGLLERIKGAFLVAVPSETALAGLADMDPKFARVPRHPLPFPSYLVASSNDPHASLEQSADMALAWGSKLVEAGEQGHINEQSGHGPWPEGMMAFAGFLSRL